MLQFRGFQRAIEKLPASKTIKSSRNAFVVCKDDVSRFFNGASETIDAIEVPIWGGPIHLIYVQSTEHDDRSLSSKLKVTNYALPPKQQLGTPSFLTALAHCPILWIHGCFACRHPCQSLSANGLLSHGPPFKVIGIPTNPWSTMSWPCHHCPSRM